MPAAGDMGAGAAGAAFWNIGLKGPGAEAAGSGCGAVSNGLNIPGAGGVGAEGAGAAAFWNIWLNGDWFSLPSGF